MIDELVWALYWAPTYELYSAPKQGLNRTVEPNRAPLYEVNGAPLQSQIELLLNTVFSTYVHTFPIA
jgi:hypothetical protein